MQTKHARLLFVLSIFLLSLVVVDFVRLGDNTKQENSSKTKVNLAEKVNEIGQVLGGGGCGDIPTLTINPGGSFTPTTITTNYKYTGQGINFPQTSTYYVVCISNSDSVSHYITPVNWPSSTTSYTPASSPAIPAGYGEMDFQNAGTYQFYVDTNSLVLGTVIAGLTPTTNSPTVSNNNNNTQSPSTSTSTKTTSKTAIKSTSTPDTIKNVTLPSEFEWQGTTTTNLVQISNPAAVANFTLETPKNKIVFSQTVDLSATDTVNKFRNIDNYVVANLPGVVSIDSSNLPALNKPATITMKNLPYVKTPRVLVNGKEDPTVVSNLKYSGGTLSFNVAHFSTFTAAPTVGINEPANNFETTNPNVTLKGTVSDPTASVSAKLNNRDLGKLKIATNGAFQKDISLDQGLNKIVVSALGANLATASASISATLLPKASGLVALLGLLLGLLGILAIALIIWSLKHLKKNMDKKVKETKKEEKPQDPTGISPTIQ